MPEVIDILHIPDENDYIVTYSSNITIGMYGDLMWSGASTTAYRYFFTSISDNLEYECCDEKLP